MINYAKNRLKIKGQDTRTLSTREKKIIGLLGLPTFGLALSVTVVVTYVPLLAKQFTSSTTVVGLIIASEGIVALFLPVLAGSYSDHLHTRVGGRLPFIIVGAPISAIALFLIGFANTIWAIIACVIIFFIAYYLAYEPYRALYPDLIEDDASGRAQSVQALWRGAGTGGALVIGSYLFAVNRWLPFTVSAILTFIVAAAFILILLKRYGVPRQHRREPSSLIESYKTVLRLLKNHHDLRNFIIANTLWELTLAALKSFILLYLTIGLGHTKFEAAAIITATAVIILLAAPLSGKLADTFGKTTVMLWSAAVFGLGLLAPLFTTNTWVALAILPIVAFGGAVVLTLPYALLIPMMPKDEHGRITGLYSTSRGLGIMLGPLLAGATISLGKNVFLAKGYSAMWLVCAASMLLSILFLRNIKNF
jgi:MFS family permease